MTKIDRRRCARDYREGWPTEDVAAWAAALVPPTDFQVRGPAHRWRPRTVSNAGKSYAAWLKWLRENNPDLLKLGPALRVTPDTACAYAQSMDQRGLKLRTIASVIAYLGMALRAIAPTEDWKWLFAASRAYTAAAPPPDFVYEIQSSAALYAVGEQLLADATGSVPGQKEIDRAVMYRDGLMIALLALSALRRSNLAGLQLGKTLLPCGDTFKVAFAAEEMKTWLPQEFDWPSALLQALRTYLADYRPVLLPEGSREKALWISKQKRRLTTEAITNIVRKRTSTALGLTVSPHRFRHAAATLIAESSPDGVTGIARLLGHASAKTGEAHYNKAKVGRAFDLHGQIVRPTRRQSRRLKRPEQLSFFDLQPE